MTKTWQLGAAAAGGVAVTLAAGWLALAATDSRIAADRLERFANADMNYDGTITRAEWLAAATRGFVRLDRNGDGKLVFSELPLGPRHGGPHGPGRDRDEDPEAMPAPGAVPAVAPTPAPTATPAG